MIISIAAAGVINNCGIDDGMRLIKEGGFEAIDLDMRYVFNDMLMTDPRWEGICIEEMQEMISPYCEAAKKYGLVFGQTHAHYPYLGHDNIIDNFERMVRVLQLEIVMCEYIGCKRIIAHPYYLGKIADLTREQLWERNISLFSQLIPELKRSRVTMCIENMMSLGGEMLTLTGEGTNQLVDALNDIAGEKCFAVCIDTGHGMLAGQDVASMIREVGWRLEALHLNDNDGLVDLHLIPYTGKLDWNKVCEALKIVGYTNSINFEIIFNPIELFPEILSYCAAAGRLIAEKIES